MASDRCLTLRVLPEGSAMRVCRLAENKFCVGREGRFVSLCHGTTAGRGINLLWNGKISTPRNKLTAHKRNGPLLYFVSVSSGSSVASVEKMGARCRAESGHSLRE